MFIYSFSRLTTHKKQAVVDGSRHMIDLTEFDQGENIRTIDVLVMLKETSVS